MDNGESTPVMEIQHFASNFTGDVTKLELLEARLQGHPLPNREVSNNVVQHIQSSNSQHSPNHGATTPTPSEEPMSDEVSGGGMSMDHTDQEVVVVRESKTPKQKARKRKMAEDPASASKKDKERDPGKKIDEYFNKNHPIKFEHIVRTGLFQNSPNSPSDSSTSQSVQTDLTGIVLQEQQQRSASNIEEKDSQIHNLIYRMETTAQENEQLKNECKSLRESVSRFSDIIKELLIEKARAERRETRRCTLEKKLRLGQFVNVRQGATYVEQWQDGFAFKEIAKRQEEIAKERDLMEKERKLLVKQKPSANSSQNSESTGKPTSEKKMSLPTLTQIEFHERDEILKLRGLWLRKEESDLATELEKIERERNLHVRDLKRQNAEDESQYRSFPTLNNRYLLLELLGKGGFSEVYKAFDLREQQFVACKIHHCNKEWREEKKQNYIKHACREYEIHKQLAHSRIVKLFDVFEISQDSFCTVMEYCDGNDLDFCLKQSKNLPEREAKSVIQQVVSALKYLNQLKKPIIHYDLKPANILMGKDTHVGEIKITDFGLSKIMDEETYSETQGGIELTSQGTGTYWYLPPEVFDDAAQGPVVISSKVDVWSVGVLFYQILYGKKPYGHNESQASILKNDTIRNAGPVEFPAKPTISPEAKNFIRRCLQRVHQRPDVLTLANDEYLVPPNRSYSRSMSSSTASGSSNHATNSASTANQASFGAASVAANSVLNSQVNVASTCVVASGRQHLNNHTISGANSAAAIIHNAAAAGANNIPPTLQHLDNNNCSYAPTSTVAPTQSTSVYRSSIEQQQQNINSFSPQVFQSTVGAPGNAPQTHLGNHNHHLGVSGCPKSSSVANIIQNPSNTSAATLLIASATYPNVSPGINSLSYSNNVSTTATAAATGATANGAAQVPPQHIYTAN